MTSKTNWNTVIRLTITQALFQTASILVMTLAGMVGLELATDKSMATFPIAMISVGTAMMMIPASLIIKKLGQKTGFMLGTVVGVAAGLLSFAGILQHSFLLFTLGTTLIGSHQAFAQYYRFAAADSVSEANKSKAISFVIAGGVVAAIAGPNLAKYTQNIGSVTFAYSFLSITLLSILALIILFSFKPQQRPVVDNANKKLTGRPLTEIIKKRDTVTALTSSAIGYSVMIMVMTATPLAMHHHGHSMSNSAVVIQWHVLGMFVPSFFTGALIKKLGVRKVILAGAAMLFLHVFFALTGTDFLNFISGLIFLGIGWNFMFIGGSTLLTKVYTNPEKENTQAFHDFLVFLVISLSSFMAGPLLNNWGWKGVNIAAIPMLMVALLVFLLPIRNRKPKEVKAILTEYY